MPELINLKEDRFIFDVLIHGLLAHLILGAHHGGEVVVE
jgi:hypothetical protein